MQCCIKAVLSAYPSHFHLTFFLVLQIDIMTPPASSLHNLWDTDMFLSLCFNTQAQRLSETIDSIKGELFCLKLSDEKATLLVSSSNGQAVKVCWVIKGYALNTVPFLLVTCQQLHTYTVWVYWIGPPPLMPCGVLQYEVKFGHIGVLAYISISDQNMFSFNVLL